MGRGFLVVEGHGDEQAALNLVVRLWEDLGLAPLHWGDPIRGKNLHREFEAFFLPCIALMAGQNLVGPAGVTRKGLRAVTTPSSSLEGPPVTAVLTPRTGFPTVRHVHMKPEIIIEYCAA